MTPAQHAILLVPAAYVLGSVPFGLIVGKSKGIDPRTAGSGNIGATNVARTLGKPLGALVLLVDAAKGFAPVFISREVLHLDAWVVAGVALLAIVGHVFPVWLKFRGGKGVATGLGVFLALDPIAAGVAVLGWIVLYAAFRLSSLGSMVASATIPLTMALRHAPRPYVVLATAALALVLFRHRGNIRRLIRHEEYKV